MKKLVRITIKQGAERHIKCVHGVAVWASHYSDRWAIGKRTSVVIDWLSTRRIPFTVMGWKARRGEGAV